MERVENPGQYKITHFHSLALRFLATIAAL